MSNAVEKLKSLRADAVEKEKLVINEKVQKAYEETRKNSEEVLRICLKELENIAKDPYSSEISEEFDCHSESECLENSDYFRDYLLFLPNFNNIVAFGYKYEIKAAARSTKPKIYFDLEYFKELVKSTQGLVMEENSVGEWIYNFRLTVEGYEECMTKEDVSILKRSANE